MPVLNTHDETIPSVPAGIFIKYDNNYNKHKGQEFRSESYRGWSKRDKKAGG